MPEDATTWRTDDMSLAAYLSLVLSQDPELEWEMDSCFFCFEQTDQLADEASNYFSGNARVEPRSYNLQHGKLKKALVRCRPKTKVG